MKSNQRKQRGARDGPSRREKQTNVRMDNLSSNTVVVRRRIVAVGVIATSGAGFIPLTSITTDQARTVGTDFSSMAARYTQWRVRAVRQRLYPIVDSTTAVTAGGGVVTPHPTAIAFASYREGLGYASFASVCTGTDARIFQGREKCIEYSADWSNNPDAHLWSATNAAIPTANVYGFQFIDTGVAPASAVSTTYYRAVYDWDVEFQGPS